MAELAGSVSGNSTQASQQAGNAAKGPVEDIIQWAPICETRDEYLALLESVKIKDPLFRECARLSIDVPKKANLKRLREALALFWFPEQRALAATATASSQLSSLTPPISAQPGLGAARAPLPQLPATPRPTGQPFNPPAGSAQTPSTPSTPSCRQIGARVQSSPPTHQQPLLLGSPFQLSTLRNLSNPSQDEDDESVDRYKPSGKIRDNIVDEHSMLIFIDYTATRPKQTPKGLDIPGTFVGAQEAADPDLRKHRPIKMSTLILDAIKTRMDEAVKCTRSGLDLPENQDAPDIIHNTVLDSIQDEQHRAIGHGFLAHRELRSAINGHLAWTTRNVSGNRGDDIRALKLAELQPYVMLHPDNHTNIPCVLALQGEEKAGLKGMQTRINPVYTTFIPHRNPERCPIGAIGLYMHYVFDVRRIHEVVGIDWSWNKSWRAIRLLHSSKDPKSPFSEQSLYNLFVKSFNIAGFQSRIKQHLPWHILPYNQRKLGISGEETSKMEWKRGQTYHDVYAPAFPKSAILGAHGFKSHEIYDPIWTHVTVPERFLSKVYPMAEGIVAEVKGHQNLVGTTNFWEMLISLRPYLFQSAAAIYQNCPNSAIFRLPALSDPDVINWMKHTFPQQLQLAEARVGEPLQLERLQNEIVAHNLQQLFTLLRGLGTQLNELTETTERRTSMLSPSKGFNLGAYSTRAEAFVSSSSLPVIVSSASPSRRTAVASQPLLTIPAYRPEQAPVPSSGTLPALPTSISAQTTLPAYQSSTPSTPSSPASSTLVPSLEPPPVEPPVQAPALEYILPPTAAFARPGIQFILPALFGHGQIQWPDIFKHITQRKPELLWPTYKPSKSLDGYGTVEALWKVWTSGESEESQDGKCLFVKPPFSLLEKEFGTSWRAKDSASRKQWQRFREIPKWIEQDSEARNLSTSAVVEELEDFRLKNKVGLNGLMLKIKKRREDAKEAANAEDVTQVKSTVPRKRKVPVDRRRPAKRKALL